MSNLIYKVNDSKGTINLAGFVISDENFNLIYDDNLVNNKIMIM